MLFISSSSAGRKSTPSRTGKCTSSLPSLKPTLGGCGLHFVHHQQPSRS